MVDKIPCTFSASGNVNATNNTGTLVVIVTPDSGGNATVFVSTRDIQIQRGNIQISTYKLPTSRPTKKLVLANVSNIYQNEYIATVGEKEHATIDALVRGAGYTISEDFDCGIDDLRNNIVWARTRDWGQV